MKAPLLPRHAIHHSRVAIPLQGGYVEDLDATEGHGERQNGVCGGALAPGLGGRVQLVKLDEDADNVVELLVGFHAQRQVQCDPFIRQVLQDLQAQDRVMQLQQHDML